jgi:hypothetical protein
MQSLFLPRKGRNPEIDVSLLEYFKGIQNTGWMTSELMEHWLGCVWGCRSGVLSKPRSMLAMDAFCGHLSDTIRNRLRNKNTDLVIIPSGMTRQLQSLEASVN